MESNSHSSFQPSEHTPTLKPRKQLDGHHDFVFSPDTKTILLEQVPPPSFSLLCSWLGAAHVTSCCRQSCWKHCRMEQGMIGCRKLGSKGASYMTCHNDTNTQHTCQHGTSDSSSHHLVLQTYRIRSLHDSTLV